MWLNSPQKGGVAQGSGSVVGPDPPSPWRSSVAAWTQDRARTDRAVSLKSKHFLQSPRRSSDLRRVGTVSARPGPCGVGLMEQRGDEAGPRGGVWTSRMLLPSPRAGGPRGGGERRNVERTNRQRTQALPVAQRPARLLHSVGPEALGARAPSPPPLQRDQRHRSFIGSRRCRSWCRVGRPPRPPGRWPAAGPGPRSSAGTWGTRSGS